MRGMGLSLLFALAAVPARAAAPEHWTIYAARAGAQALDGDRFGGNPFASALITALGDGAARSADFLAELEEYTVIYSEGRQRPDLSAAPASAGIMPVPGRRAVALVAVFADYGDLAGFASLPGAAFDAARVRRALAAAGYDARLVIAATRVEYLAEVESFRDEAARADDALLYTTGHGSEAGGTVWLLPPDFDLASPDLTAGAIRIGDLHSMLNAKVRNVVIYAGCRDNPLNLKP